MHLIYTGLINEKNVQNFVFSDKYNISYDIDTKSIKIERRKTSIPDDFFGKNIDRVNLVVGENGTGKTTLLEAIGFSSNVDNNKISCINLYEYKDTNQENQFVIEGSNKDLLGFSKTSVSLGSTKASFCYNASYDFDSQSFKKPRFSESKDPHIKSFQIVSEESHYRSNSAFIKRSKVCNYNEKDEFDFLLADSKSNNIFLNKENIYPMEFVLNIFPVIKNFQGEINALKSVLGENLRTLENFEPLSSQLSMDIDQIIGRSYKNEKKYSNKQHFILLLKFSLIVEMSRKIIEENERSLIKKELTSTIDLVSSTDFDDAFNKVINKLCVILSHLDLMKTDDKNIVHDLIDSVSELPENYFSDLNTITFRISEEHRKEKDKLSAAIASSRSKLSMINFLKSDIKNISSGQKKLIEIMSRVYALKSQLSSGISEFKNVLFLIDEPDLYLHPEWSRKLLESLISTLGLISNVRFSIIITTHSPFLLSDIPGDLILKISSCEGKHAVFRSKGGYGKNIYDILHDSFFLSSFIGEFAKSKINSILQQIDPSRPDNRPPSWITDKVANENIEKEIDLIGDPVLRSQLGAMKFEAEKKYLINGNYERRKRIEQLIDIYIKDSRSD